MSEDNPNEKTRVFILPLEGVVSRYQPDNYGFGCIELGCLEAEFYSLGYGCQPRRDSAQAELRLNPKLNIWARFVSWFYRLNDRLENGGNVHSEKVLESDSQAKGYYFEFNNLDSAQRFATCVNREREYRAVIGS